MSDRHSYGEFILGTYKALLVDCASQYPVLTKEFNRDFQRLSSAIDCHGIRFFLDTMPAYRKHFDQCLAKQRLSLSGFINFGTWYKGGTIPRLFRGLILRVFDKDGVLRHDADENAIRLIRQLLGAVRKLGMPSNIKDTGKTVLEFFDVDRAVRKGDLNWDHPDEFDVAVESNETSFDDLTTSPAGANLPSKGEQQGSELPYGLLTKVQQCADYLTSKLGLFDPTVWKPRHGPGAVSDQPFGAYKYAFERWPERLEHIFPYADFAVANYAQVETCDAAMDRSHEFYQERPAKLCAVPKTLSTPRLIASEPTNLQWCQQIIRDFLYSRVRDTIISRFLDFRQQEKNGNLALKASHDASHSTIDLSSASDRISCWHVERLFRRSPSLLRALQATRSEWIEQEICRISPRYYNLRKYSTMGNATTFPVQSLFFLSLALGALCYTRNLKVGDLNICELGSEQVRVFGDDIIVPKDCTGVLLELLQALGLKVNPNKTFTEGNFRESCGVDAYRGHNVTTVNILDVPKRASPGSIVSTVDVHNNLCEEGYMHTAAYIRKIAERIVRNRIRFVKHGSGLFGWSNMYGGDTTNLRIRHNRHLHIGEIQCLKLKVSEQRTEAKEPAALLQYFTEAPNVVTSAISTLSHLVQRPKVRLSLGWAPI